MIKAIIFDYDGVIVDSFGDVFKVYQKICQHFKVPCPKTVDDFRKIYGHNYIECLSNLGIPFKQLSKVNDIYRREIIKMNPDVFTGIVAVIRELSKKYKLYLVSSSYREEVLSKLERLALIKSFSKIYCGADLRAHKRAIIEELIKKNNYLPSETISIGDRLVDYQAAKGVGLDDSHIILMSYGWGFDRDTVGRAYIADQAKDILNIIK